MKFKNIMEDVRPELYEVASQLGSMERIDYTGTNYDGRKMDKHAYVYLPYNYDETKEYDILYLIHGGGESAEKYMYQDGENNPLKRAVDNMIEKGEIKPLIIVTPSPYPDHKVVTSGDDNVSFVYHFHNELCKELMPAVEAKYHTYSNFKSDEESLMAAREHRAVMGWSMGSFTTWCVFLNRIAYFNKFGFLSCYYGLISDPATIEWAEEHANEIVEKVKEQGYTKKDYNIFAATGTLDKTVDKFSLEMSNLLAYPDYFDFHSEEQNTTYLMWPQGEHHTRWRLIYIINGIKQFFE